MKTLPTILIISATVALVTVFQLYQTGEDRESFDGTVALSTDVTDAAVAEPLAVLGSPIPLTDKPKNGKENASKKFGQTGYQEYIDHSSNDARAMSPNQWSDTGELSFAAPSYATPAQQIPSQQMQVQQLPIQQFPQMNGSPVIATEIQQGSTRIHPRASPQSNPCRGSPLVRTIFLIRISRQLHMGD